LKNQESCLSAKIKADAEAATGIINQTVDAAVQRISECVCATEHRVKDLVETAARTGAIVGQQLQAQLGAEQSMTELRTGLEEIKERVSRRP